MYRVEIQDCTLSHAWDGVVDILIIVHRQYNYATSWRQEEDEASLVVLVYDIQPVVHVTFHSCAFAEALSLTISYRTM